MFRSLGFGVALSFILGFSLVAIVLLVGTWVPSITFRKPETLPAGCLEQLKKWKESETITSVVVDLTKGQVKKLAEVVARSFGDVLLTRATGERVKVWRVGMQVEPSGERDGRPLSRVILYRRDLAADRKLRKPWRVVPKQPYLAQTLVELPVWME